MFDLNSLYNADCMDAMKDFPDRFFDLAIVDVPYGINTGDYKRGGQQHGHAAAASTVYTRKDWYKAPPPASYFSELRRISKNQIVWGANHFISRLPLDSPYWIVWDKQNGDNGYADCELAWTSFKSAVRQFSFKWQGMLQGDMKNKESRIHPTQKPVALYRWLLQRYAAPGYKIIDTHSGSASSLIACWEMGLDFIGFEIDTEYYTSANERLQSVMAQVRFDIPQFAGGGAYIEIL
ncbi:methyltransferase [Clostridia bacterium]|nr:methyltransferase [Clostridia bacterium]